MLIEVYYSYAVQNTRQNTASDINVYESALAVPFIDLGGGGVIRLALR